MMQKEGQPSLANLFSRLDPLLALGSMVAARRVIVSFAPALIIVLLTLAVGRVWCGWICPLGTILDLFGRRGQRGTPPKFRQVKYYLLFTILFLALFGSLAFMFFDPITVLIRGLAGVIYPGIQQISPVAANLAPVKTVLEGIGISAGPAPGTPIPRPAAAAAAPPLSEQLLALPWAAASLLLIILLLNIVERRFWCRYLCPLGGFIGLLSRFAWLKRDVEEKEGLTPCRLDCPAGTNVVGFTALISKGKLKQAVDLIRQRNPLTTVCGHVCPHPCEADCNRKECDEAVGINSLERFVGDYVRKRGKGQVKPTPITRDQKVAVIGAGPAGLSAAYHLRKKGYEVKVFEKLPVPGGMLAAGIPRYRLPREVLQSDIDFIKKHGVEIQTNVEVDRQKLEEMRQEYDALFISVGAHKSQELGIPGEDLAGVIHGVDFLRALNLSQEAKLGSKVAVIGGGDVAIDAARCALRLGSEVTIYYRRSREEMPARSEEVAEAEEEGVKIQYLASPTRIISENGRVVAIECIRSELGAPDESGRRRPIPIPGSEFVESVDTVIPAIGQYSDLALLEGSGIELERGRVKANEVGMTSVPGVFAGGDVVTGPAMVADAIGAGAEAATAIDKYLRGEPLTVEERPEVRIKFEDLPRDRLPEKQGRQVAATIAIETRKKSFDEVRLGLSQKAALQEARRCINWNCAECTLCAQVCPMGTIESKDFTSHPSECTMCMDCMDACPPGVTTFRGGWLSSPVHEYDPSRRQLLASGATAVIGFGLLRTGVGKSENPFLLRPPGARPEAEFQAKCVRCGQCLKVCPRQTLRPVLFEAGWDGIWTPVLVARVGGCDYDCNACGQVCPSEAIPPLSLEEKRKAVIGTAQVDYDRCIGCAICEKACPVGAIERVQMEGKKGKFPQVALELCIGCGICEYECPVEGESAIRIYVPGALSG
jgi:NADPH-dependent glutamate synthase beta subunit-like oxidoreductase